MVRALDVMNILVIASCFPSRGAPYNGAFLKSTMLEFVRRGNCVTVVCPYPLHKPRMPFKTHEEGIVVFRPRYVSLGSRRLGFLSCLKLTHKFFTRAVLRVVGQLDVMPDVLYSHFALPAGQACATVGERLELPSHCALGEDSFFPYMEHYGQQGLKEIFKSIDYLYPNCLRIKSELVLDFERVFGVHLVENGVDTRVFCPISKGDIRVELGLPVEAKIVIFVGSFIDRKGPLRVLDAIRKLDDVKLICVGSGPQVPEDDRVLFSGTLQPNMLAKFLNAADIFVLPSKSEGMPNAVLEAMACNIPIVATDLPVNIELLNGYPSYELVAADDVKGISLGILSLLNTAKNFSQYDFQYSVRTRVDKLLDLFDQKL